MEVWKGCDIMKKVLFVILTIVVLVVGGLAFIKYNDVQELKTIDYFDYDEETGETVYWNHGTKYTKDEWNSIHTNKGNCYFGFYGIED